MVNVAVSDVALVAFTLLTAIPLPLTETVVTAPGSNLVPVNITVMLLPLRPAAGEMDVKVGVGALTVNGRAPVVPLAVVTVTSRAPAAASAAIVSVAVNEVLLATFT